MNGPGESIIELHGVSHAGTPAEGEPTAPLRALSLILRGGSFTVIRGDAASGKHALLRVLGLFETPEKGEVIFEGEPTGRWNDDRRAERRAHRCGLLFSAPFLLPSLTVAENIAMPMFKVGGASTADASGRAAALLAFTGLADRAQTAAGELSQEEQYAAAIARALANQPALLLVEDLDATLNGEALVRVAGLLRAAAKQFGIAVAASVSLDFHASGTERILELVAGRFPAEPALPPVPMA
jgi:putative ABC transport system ATP-binding protein